MALTKSPLAPRTTPVMPEIEGVRIATYAMGMRYKGRDDLLFMEFVPGTQVAGVFTKSSTASACIDWERQILSQHSARASIVVAGISNVFNGAAGMRTVKLIAHKVAAMLGCLPQEIHFSATGIIGIPLPDPLIEESLSTVRDHFHADGWHKAAAAICTTDTFPKCATRTVAIGNAQVTINGIVKGSGMIEPNMATMLGYIATDAAIPAPILQSLLSESIEPTFNAITVDSDTSTSDTILLFATGQAKHEAITSAQAPVLSAFKAALTDICKELAQLVVRDGEGASKFITVNVKGAHNDQEAKIIAKSIANSPLVKTAIAGADANWGRIAAAIGKTSAMVDQTRLSIGIGDVWMAVKGQLNPQYQESQIVDYMKGDEITIRVDVGLGAGQSTVWTCDLTEGYIHINADYRS